MAFLYRSTCFQFSEDLDVGEELTNKVYIRDHDCVDHGWDDDDVNYLQCLDCKQPAVQRRFSSRN